MTQDSTSKVDAGIAALGALQSRDEKLHRAGGGMTVEATHYFLQAAETLTMDEQNNLALALDMVIALDRIVTEPMARAAVDAIKRNRPQPMILRYRCHFCGCNYVEAEGAYCSEFCSINETVLAKQEADADRLRGPR